MLKRLLLIFLFSGSLDSFSQETDTMPLQLFDANKWPKDSPGYSMVYLHDFGQPCKCSRCQAKNAPDTLRAIILVTLSPNGIAHARMGYVVICEGKEVVYLDCRKRALKMPQVGWGYRVVGNNIKIK